MGVMWAPGQAASRGHFPGAHSPPLGMFPRALGVVMAIASATGPDELPACCDSGTPGEGGAGDRGPSGVEDGGH